MVSSTFEDFTAYTEEQKPLGSKVGYKHLWLEATGRTANPNACYTWVNGNRFYSITTLSDANTEFFLTRLGANDPNFNLRYDPALILRQNDAKDHTFVSIIEPHGLYDLKMEITKSYASNIEKVTLLLDNDEYSIAKVDTKNGGEYTLLVSNSNTDAKAKHSIEVEGKKYSWTGAYSFITK
jgi:hypothetical protein